VVARADRCRPSPQGADPAGSLPACRESRWSRGQHRRRRSSSRPTHLCSLLLLVLAVACSRGSALTPEQQETMASLPECTQRHIRDLDGLADLDIIGPLLVVAGTFAGVQQPLPMTADAVDVAREALAGVPQYQRAQMADTVRGGFATCGNALCNNPDGLFWVDIARSLGIADVVCPGDSASVDDSGPHGRAQGDRGSGDCDDAGWLWHLICEAGEDAPS
jgi:hypothetical protein